jgi:hypothetical protein
MPAASWPTAIERNKLRTMLRGSSTRNDPLGPPPMTTRAESRSCARSSGLFAWTRRLRSACWPIVPCLMMSAGCSTVQQPLPMGPPAGILPMGPVPRLAIADGQRATAADLLRLNLDLFEHAGECGARLRAALGEGVRQ